MKNKIKSPINRTAEPNKRESKKELQKKSLNQHNGKAISLALLKLFNKK
jgi:hypothetical protein